MRFMDDMPDVRQLEAFTAVMSAGSITGAARLTGRSQPAVTRLIQELEAAVGFSLLHRSGPRVFPTAQGVRFHQEAERVLVSLRQIGARADAIAREQPGPIEIAAIPALAGGLVPASLARLTPALPNEIHLHSLSAEQVVQAVLSRRAELGLASLPVDHPGLETHWVAEAPCVIVLAAEDPLASQAVVSLRALAARRLLTVANPFRLRRRVAQALDAIGVTPPAIMAMNTSLTALSAVRAGLGVAVVEPVTAYGTPIAGVVVRPLDVTIPFLWGVVTPFGRPLDGTVAALIDALRHTAAALLPGFRLRDLNDREAIAAAVYGGQPEGVAA
jgi:DNA-binding transcriptional LysR family regulator